MKKLSFCLLVFFSCTITSVFAQSDDARGLKEVYGEHRIALVIGNSNYFEATSLRNPIHDATDIAQILKARKFDVTLLTNTTRKSMVKAIQRFGKELKKGGVGLLYYAGHGMQIAGKNYMIPVDATPQEEHEVHLESVSIDRVLGYMENADNRLNIIILDACRDNPFTRSFSRSSGIQGLAQMDAPTGTLIAYATAPGSIAADGTRRNGVYTEKLLTHIQTPGLKIEEVFKQVRADVSEETDEKQVPWESTSLTGDFYFTPIDAVHDEFVIAGNTGVSNEQMPEEEEIWYMVKDSKQIQDIKEFLEEFPNGHYSRRARFKLKQLQRKLQEQVNDPTSPSSINETISNTAESGLELYEKAMQYYWGSGVTQNYELAIELLKKAVEKNHGRAASILSYIDYAGYSGKIKPKDSFLMSQVAANLDDVYGKLLLALHLRYGFGTEIQKNRANDILSKIVSTVKEQSLKEDPFLQDSLGLIYRYGFGVEKDYQEAFKWHKKAATQGHAEAEANLGHIYFNGLGVNKDYEEAFRWYQNAAKKNLTEATAHLAKMYQHGYGVEKNLDQAFKLYLRAAEKNYGMAQNELGVMYFKGEGVNQNYEEALKWAQKAVEQRYAGAQYNLGYMYQYGYGVEKDFQKAFNWYKKAVEQEYATAKHQLGIMYYYGQYVKQDYGEALNWFQQAAANRADSQNWLGHLYEKGLGVKRDYEKALKWYRQATESGHAGAQVNLGHMYRQGRGVKQDIQEALRWYRKAADSGYHWAQLHLGRMFYTGKEVEQDYAEALMWLQKAAEQKNAQAQNLLGIMYRQGSGVDQNNQEALRWYKKSAEQGYKWGQYNLGWMYEKANGVDYSKEEAMKWYKKASDQGLEEAQEAYERVEANWW